MLEDVPATCHMKTPSDVVVLKRIIIPSPLSKASKAHVKFLAAEDVQAKIDSILKPVSQGGHFSLHFGGHILRHGEPNVLSIMPDILRSIRAWIDTYEAAWPLGGALWETQHCEGSSRQPPQPHSSMLLP